MVVENSIKSQKPLEIGDLRVPSDSGSGEAAKRSKPGPQRLSGAILGPGKAIPRGAANLMTEGSRALRARGSGHPEPLCSSDPAKPF